MGLFLTTFIFYGFCHVSLLQFLIIFKHLFPLCLCSAIFLICYHFHVPTLIIHSVIMFIVSVCYHIVATMLLLINALDIIENKGLPSMVFQDLNKSWMNELANMI